MIRDLWNQGTDSIQDMRVVNTDDISYQSKTPEKCLYSAEREKKKNYLNACLNMCQHYTPFVASVGGLLGVEVEVTLERIVSRLTKSENSRTRVPTGT